MTGTKADGEVRDVVVLGLTGAVGSHDAPASLLGHFDGVDGLGNGTDLVHLEQQSVTKLLIHSGLDKVRVGAAKEVIPDDLNVRTLLHQDVVVGVIVLVGRILD